MTINNLRLDGCAPTPLAFYLKAIGILRLVSEQADPSVRGWWNGDRFHLATSLNTTTLEHFLLRDYEPTPFLSSWNRGSGFFIENDPGLKPLESATAKRFNAFNRGIRNSQSLLKGLKDADGAVRAIKEETKDSSISPAERKRIRDSYEYQQRLKEAEKRFKHEKSDLLPLLRKGVRGQIREWMDAAMVLDAEGIPKYPSLLGTGGSDGRFDFTNNAMKRLAEIFDLESDEGNPKLSATQWVRGSLWGQASLCSLGGKPAGQYLPGTAGGANNSNGPEADSAINPWDFVLLLEGAVAFTSHATKKMGAANASKTASPFSLNSCAAAYASASSSDEGSRGEQWMPLWANPTTYQELKQMLSEGRAQLNAKQVQEPLDMARAVARLGTARGITSFQRYGYIERNGQSNLAVPIGRFAVKRQQSVHVVCLDDLDAWLMRLRREARNPSSSARLIQAERNLLDALFRATESPELPHLWQKILLCLGQIEAIMRTGSGFSAQPIPKLRPEWASACNDGSAEFRLALCFALQAKGFRNSGQPIDAVRRHWLPLDKWQSRFATSGGVGSVRLESRPDVVMDGRRGADDAIALIERRLVEASQESIRQLPLRSAPRISAQMTDLSQLISGDIDLDRVIALSTPLMALCHTAWAEQYVAIESPKEEVTWPDDAWLAIRLCTLPWPIHLRGSELHIGTDPALVRRLAVGDSVSALEIALRRLHAAGVRCSVRGGSVPPDSARLWGAALAFPINQATAQKFLYRLNPSKE